MAVWSRWDDSRYNIWAARYASGSGWTAPQRIENNNADSAEYPQIAVDAAGNAIAVWQPCDDWSCGTNTKIWAARYE